MCNAAPSSCTVCHSRHAFSIAQAYKPSACAACHPGLDHPNTEIFNHSKHGRIFNTAKESKVRGSNDEIVDSGDTVQIKKALACVAGFSETSDQPSRLSMSSAVSFPLSLLTPLRRFTAIAHVWLQLIISVHVLNTRPPLSIIESRL
jgi:hypothetical protein